MAIDPIAELPPGYSTDTTSTATKTKDATSLDKDAFLKLLVAQLKYQNPLSPADPTQFMAQTAQFSMVEQLQNMAVDQKASALSQQLSTASSIVGKQITWLGTDGKSQTGIASSASLTSGTTVLTVGTTKVPITAVQEIAPAPAPVVPPAAVVPPAPVDQSS